MQYRPVTYAVQFGTIIIIGMVGFAIGGIVGALLAIGLLAFLGMWKMRHMNKDADEQKLIALLVAAAETYSMIPHKPQCPSMPILGNWVGDELRAASEWRMRCPLLNTRQRSATSTQGRRFCGAHLWTVLGNGESRPKSVIGIVRAILFV
jgi:hypothetical protein